MHQVLQWFDLCDGYRLLDPLATPVIPNAAPGNGDVESDEDNTEHPVTHVGGG